MNENKSPEVGLDQRFFRRLGEENATAEPPEVDLKNVITKELKFKDLNDRLSKARQEKVRIREVVLETEIDFVSSLKQLKSVFKEELKTAIDRTNDLYRNELLKLQGLYRSEVIGDRLMDIVKKVSTAGWCLLMKDQSVNLCKFYNPPFEVRIGTSENMGEVREYSTAVCELKAIYVNILHTEITSGTIHLSTVNQHPNCDEKNFGVACTGSLDERPIPLDNSDKLLELLNEISATYERIHLDSTYYDPNIGYSLRKDLLWKTTA